jgi:hypothetical protein
MVERHPHFPLLESYWDNNIEHISSWRRER